MKYLLVFLRFLSLAHVILVMGCTGKKADYKTVEGSPILSIPRLNDTTFLSGEIGAIHCAGENYAISDMGANKVYFLNAQLQLEEVIGRSGQGPGEYILPVGIYYDGSKFYVASSDNKINIYKWSAENEQWMFEDDIPIPNFFGYANNFLVRNKFFYLTTIPDDLVEKRNLESEVVDQFGVFEIENPDRKFMHLIGEKDFVYLIGISEPVILKYTYEGMPVATQTYYEHEILKTAMEEQEKIYKKFPKNTTSTIFKDVCIMGNQIFILFMDRKPDHLIDTKMIVIDKTSLQITHLIELQDTYSKICPSIDNKQIIGYNLANGNLEIFDMQELD